MVWIKVKKLLDMTSSHGGVPFCAGDCCERSVAIEAIEAIE
jgi:hypothetical protein